MTSGKREILINAAWNWCGFAVSVAVTFVVSPLVIRGLGEQRYGIWALVEAAVGYIALLDLGIGASIVRYVAKFEAVEDRGELQRIFSTTLYLFTGIAAAAMVLCAAAALGWQRPLGVPAALGPEVRGLLMLLGASVALELVGGVFTAVLYGLGRFPARVAIEVSVRVAMAVAVVATLARGGGLLALACLGLCATLGKALAAALLVRRYLPYLSFSPRWASRRTFRTIRGYSLRAFLAMVAGRISFQTGAIVIGVFLLPEWVTFFVVAARLTDYAKDAIRALTNAITPAVSGLEARGDRQSIRTALVDGTRYVLWVIVPIELGLVVFGRSFLALWLGPRYAVLSYPVLVILSLPLFLTLSQYVSGRILYGMGRLTWFTAAACAEAAANLLLSLLLVNRWGIEGVAWATAMPNVCFNLALMVHVCRLLGLPVRDYVREALLPPLAVALLAPAVWLSVAAVCPITSWATFILIGAGGTLVYACAAAVVETRRHAAWHRAWARARAARLMDINPAAPRTLVEEPVE